MADFNVALQELLADEGVYSNNPHDLGGETVYGIARKFNPNWPAWSLVDAHVRDYPNLVELNKAIEADPHITDATAAFYRQRYWNFDKVASQAVASRMLSMEVNFGTGTAVRIVQESLNELGHSLVVDGNLGAGTLGLIADETEPRLMHMLRAFAALYRVHRILARPDQIQFAKGWLIRDTA